MKLFLRLLVCATAVSASLSAVPGEPEGTSLILASRASYGTDFVKPELASVECARGTLTDSMKHLGITEPHIEMLSTKKPYHCLLQRVGSSATLWVSKEMVERMFKQADGNLKAFEEALQTACIVEYLREHPFIRASHTWWRCIAPVSSISALGCGVCGVVSCVFAISACRCLAAGLTKSNMEHSDVAELSRPLLNVCDRVCDSCCNSIGTCSCMVMGMWCYDMCNRSKNPDATFSVDAIEVTSKHKAKAPRVKVDPIHPLAWNPCVAPEWDMCAEIDNKMVVQPSIQQAYKLGAKDSALELLGNVDNALEREKEAAYYPGVEGEEDAYEYHVWQHLSRWKKFLSIVCCQRNKMKTSLYRTFSKLADENC